MITDRNERTGDRIRIIDLEVFANHGVFPEENALGQKFVISADLYTDTRKAVLRCGSTCAALRQGRRKTRF